MPRVDLQCGCGHSFFVADTSLTPQRTVACPACDEMVMAPAAPKGHAPKKPPTAKAVSAPIVAAPSRKGVYFTIGVVAVVVVILGIVVSSLFSKPTVDYDAEAAKAVEAKKKAFESAVGKETPKPIAVEPKPVKATPAPAPVVPPPKPEVKVEPKPEPKAPPAPAPPSGLLTAEILLPLRTDVLTLHPFYFNLVLDPEERKRVEALVAAGQGSVADANFVKAILDSPKLKAVREEIAQIPSSMVTTEREVMNQLPVDRVTMSDGRVMNCRVLDDSAEIVKVLKPATSGVGTILPLRRDTVSKIEKGKGNGADFAGRWESAQKGPVDGLRGLLTWCKSGSLGPATKLVALAIAKQDPSDAAVRADAGLPADPVRNAEEIAKGGVIVYQGKNWPATELKEKFLKDGYTILNGQWCSRKEKVLSVPSLFKYEKMTDKPVLISANGLLCSETETTWKPVNDPNTNAFTETPEVKELRRFYAPPMKVGLTGRIPPGIVAPPSSYELDIRLLVDEGEPRAGTPMTGEVKLFAQAGAPILEASVMTAAEVKAGGAVTVFHVSGTVDNEKRTRLYACDARERELHAIPAELVRGQTEVSLVVVVEFPAAYTAKVDKRHGRNVILKGKTQIAPAIDVVHHRQIPDYKAMLFPSTPGTGEVFRLRAIVAEPAEPLNKLFSASPELLK